MLAGNGIGKKVAKELRKIESSVRQQRSAKRKKYQQTITLILLSHQYSEESAFHVLPLEIIHMIIRFVLDDMPGKSRFYVQL